ncbi:XRE family transcriptional regulator [Flavobacterium soyangense]|uniref:XRE family transcriptional regulator n=1 Tax=Flavobacterium soyangense TaxID=2023265 RepID=A0A930U7T3_9FLAO|nr:XRE family transcriptional regulator [Flavobacterium soyangense]MBF2708336.1 XRE family transcriptional regulator [Flavobacterium soyangense]
MQSELDEIQLEITKRIYILFLEKFNGNKLAFAKAANCDEKTIRRLFDNKQGMTINLLFKLAFALKIKPSILLENLNLNDQD